MATPTRPSAPSHDHADEEPAHDHDDHAHAGLDHAGHDHDHSEPVHAGHAQGGSGAHAGHSHAPPNERRAFWAAILTGGFTIVEVVGGILAGSLALIADGGHMLADSAGLFLAWMAFRIARRPADRRRTYGFARMEVLVAFANGLFLLGLAAFILIEAVGRLVSPVAVDWLPMLIVAIGGLLANLGAFAILHGGARDNLNMRGAMLHVVGDLLGSVGAIAAALIIMATGWLPADPILSVFVTLLIVASAVRLVRESAHILLEGAPADIVIADIEADIPLTVPGVASIHHVHAWSISEGRPMVTLHACVGEDTAAPAAILAIKQRLLARFGIEHATVEVERGECADAVIRSPSTAPHC